ncbi:hypothetical protein Q7P37_009803 [Cladosporium fusiforme]
MAEHYSFTPAVRNWKSLSGQELHRRLTSLGLALDTEEKVIICKKCQYVLKPSDAVSKHLGDRHEISAKARHGLNAFVKQLQLPDPSRLEPRPDGYPPHPNLATKSGVACGQCNYRSTSLDLAQRHLAKTHGEKSARKTWLRDHLRKDLFPQSWTQNGSTYWIVVLNEANNSGPHLDTPQASPQRRQNLTALHERELQRARNEETRLPGEDSSASDLALTSNWIRRTGWLETFAGVDRQLLSRLGSAPAREGFPLLLADDVGGLTQSSIEDESKLSNLGKAADHFFDRCEDTARNTDHSIRCWLRSHVQGRPYKAAFQLPGRCTTRKRYRWLWKSMIYFVLRLWRLDDAVRERMLGLRLSTKQSKAIEEIWSILSADEDAIKSIALANALDHHPALDDDPRIILADEESYVSQRCKSSGARDHGILDESVTSLHGEMRPETFASSVSVESSDGFESSTTDESEYSQDDDGLMRSLHPTKPAAEFLIHDGDAMKQKLADLVGTLSIQLCKENFVDGRPSSTILIYFSGVLGLSADPSTFERPRNYTSKLSGLIYCARLCFLESVLPRFAHDYVGWEKRPRLGGLKLLNRVRERYMCLGCQSPLGELLSLRNFGRSLSRSDGPSFRVGWSPDSQTVSWDDGQLSMTQFRGLSKTAFDSATTCVERLMYGLEPRLQLHHIRDCEGWNYKSVHRYLEEEDRLLSQLMLILYLCGGQALRSTELFSIEHWNGPTTSRGLYAHRGAICFVTRHTKARHSTNQEFQVARYLPRRESDLVLSYLVYIRPIVDMLNRECFGSKKARPLFFSSSNDPERPWKVEVLTKALKRLSTAVCGTHFGVQVYRQLSIAVTEKHVKHISRPFDRNDDESADAAIEVAYAWQSGHLPVQRGTTYGIDSAFPDSLKPALLEVYYWASMEWHNFISAPGSVLNIPIATSYLAKALGEMKASHKRRASESIGEARQIEHCKPEDSSTDFD